jgi:hypothetical protein
MTSRARAGSGLLGAPAWLSVLVVASAGCLSWSRYDLRVPLGTSGGFPAYVGRACQAAHQGVGPGALVVEAQTETQGARWHAGRAGKLGVTCERARARLVSVPIARLRIEVQSNFRLGERTLDWLEMKAEDSEGQEIDLSLVDSDQLHWIVPEGVYSRGPSCGHMVPLCAGGPLGNGRSLRVEFKGDTPIPVRAQVGPVGAPIYETKIELAPAPRAD